MVRSFSELESGVKLEVAAKVISDNGGTMKVDFLPPLEFRERSSFVAGLVLTKLRYEKSKGYKPREFY